MGGVMTGEKAIIPNGEALDMGEVILAGKRSNGFATSTSSSLSRSDGSSVRSDGTGRKAVIFWTGTVAAVVALTFLAHSS